MARATVLRAQQRVRRGSQRFVLASVSYRPLANREACTGLVLAVESSERSTEACGDFQRSQNQQDCPTRPSACRSALTLSPAAVATDSHSGPTPRGSAR